MGRGSDLHLQAGDLLLVGGGREEAAHLTLQRIVHFHVDVETRRLLLIARVHAVHKHTSRVT